MKKISATHSFDIYIEIMLIYMITMALPKMMHYLSNAGEYEHSYINAICAKDVLPKSARIFGILVSIIFKTGVWDGIDGNNTGNATERGGPKIDTKNAVKKSV